MTDSTDLEKARLSIIEGARTYGEQRRINPYAVLLEEVRWRAGHVAWIRDQITLHTTSRNFFVEAENGYMHDNPWVRRYDKERNMLDRVCKMAVDAGIAERYVQLAELQGATLAKVMDKALVEVGISHEQRVKIGPALRRALASVEAEAQAELGMIHSDIVK